MERGTLKTRTIFIATRGKTALYRDVDEIPPRLRRKLIKSTSGSNSGTVLIADRRGLQELVRAGLRERPAPKPKVRRRTRIMLEFATAHWPEMGLAGALAVLLWLALLIR
jgi:hypothetical protein